MVEGGTTKPGGNPVIEARELAEIPTLPVNRLEPVFDIEEAARTAKLPAVPSGTFAGWAKQHAADRRNIVKVFKSPPLPKAHLRKCGTIKCELEAIGAARERSGQAGSQLTNLRWRQIRFSATAFDRLSEQLQ
jgi:hypothetical protein